MSLVHKKSDHNSGLTYGSTDNQKITNLKQMTKLIADGKSGLTDHEISQLNPIELDISDNPHITNLNHMTNLLKLDAS